MNRQRESEKTSKPHDHTHRTSRGYEINGQWYFELRDGGQKGPFESELKMHAALNEFIQLHEEMNQQN